MATGRAHDGTRARTPTQGADPGSLAASRHARVIARRRHGRRRAIIGVGVVLLVVALTVQREDNSGAATPAPPKISGAVGGVREIVVGYAVSPGVRELTATSYRATCTSTNGGVSNTSTWSSVPPIIVKGLTAGKRYSCTAEARNAKGIGEASGPSEIVALAAAPGAPSASSVAGLGTSVLVAFQPPANDGGAAINRYQASCRSKVTGRVRRSKWTVRSPALVKRLMWDLPYDCTVRARNAVGRGPFSWAVSGTTAASGAPIPAAAPPGWRQVFADTFNTINPNSWGKYEGVPGSDPGGFWLPSHVNARFGYAELASYVDGSRWASGGMSSAHALKQAYGKYLVRFRIDKGYGVSYAILLWPSTGTWPTAGEIDFAEDGGTNNRSRTTATLHYGANDSIIQRSIAADFSQWHTVGVEWTPNRLVYTLDGASWATVNSPNVPRGPMELDIQTHTGTCSDPERPCPNGTTPSRVNMQVDWVVAYAPA